MQQITIKTKDFFNAIKEHEDATFIKDYFHELKTEIKIQDENNNWIKIKNLVIKEKPTVKLMMFKSDPIIVSENHLICFDKTKCIEAINSKDKSIIKSDGRSDLIVDVIKQSENEIVFDFEVDSTTHLYQTSDGIIHHNSGKGKSLVATVALGNNIKMGGHSVNVDIEESVNNKEFIDKIVGSKEIADKISMISSKVDPKTGLVRPITIEKLNSLLNKMLDFQSSLSDKKSKSLCVLVDSFSALTTDKEVDDTRADKDTRDMTAQQKMRGMLRVVVQSMRHANMTMIGIGQMTANIGVMFGPKSVESVKGSAPKYWSSLTLQMISDKEIEDPKTKIPIGIKMRFKTTKNRIQYKGRDGWLHFYFKNGIDRAGGLPELLACYGIFKASSKKSVTNDFSPTTEFKYTTNAGKELKFKGRQFNKIIDENGGIEFIKELNDKLNAVYDSTLEGVSPEDFMDSDDYLDEQEYSMDESTIAEEDEQYQE